MVTTYKVFQYLVYDDTLWSASQRRENEREVNVVAFSESEANEIMTKQYPSNGIGRDNWIFKQIVCQVHHINTP